MQHMAVYSVGKTMWISALYLLCCLLAKQCVSVDHQSNVKGGTNGVDPRHDGEFVGASVWINEPLTVTEGSPVLYNSVLVNNGNHYRPATGRFVCPVSGAYYVAISSQQDSTVRFQLNLMRNTDIVFSSLFDDLGGNPSNTISSSSVTQCEANDFLYVHCNNASCPLYGRTGEPVTTFSVMLMAPNGTYGMHSSFVGFSALKSLNQNCSSGDTVEYSNVIYNVGSYYQPILGRFNCPATGIYFNSATMYRSEQPPPLAIETKTRSVLHINDTEPGNSYTTTTNAGLVRCEAGDFIRMKCTGDGEVAALSTSSMMTSMLLMVPTPSKMHDAFVGCTMYKQTTQDYANGDIITFGGMIVNEGNAFAFNRFTCPVDGFYFVSLNLQKAGQSELHIDVVMQTVSILCLDDEQDNNTNKILSNTVITRCFAGLDMAVIASGNGAVYGDHNIAQSTFTVFLIQ